MVARWQNKDGKVVNGDGNDDDDGDTEDEYGDDDNIGKYDGDDGNEDSHAYNPSVAQANATTQALLKPKRWGGATPPSSLALAHACAMQSCQPRIRSHCHRLAKTVLTHSSPPAAWIGVRRFQTVGS